MGYERYSRDSNQGKYYNSGDPQDYGQDYGSGRDYSYSSARQYEAAGDYDRDRARDAYRDRDQSRGSYGDRSYGAGSYNAGNDRPYGTQGYGRRDYGYNRYEQRDRSYNDSPYGTRESYAGNYGGGNRFGEANPDYYGTRGMGDYGAGGSDGDRGFLQRAGDEVRSWFGDSDAEQRRQRDMQYDQARYGYDRDDDYGSWRRGQIDALDRDYHEYRNENRQRFGNEFGAWRTERQGQRTSLSRVTEHMEVVGSDGEHVGTVDKVRGDRIILTKSDADAGGRHHSIPSRWIKSVDDKVTVSKTADEAQSHWRDEERNQAMFGDRDQDDSGIGRNHNLNRSFSGTY